MPLQLTTGTRPCPQLKTGAEIFGAEKERAAAKLPLSGYDFTQEQSTPKRLPRPGKRMRGRPAPLIGLWARPSLLNQKRQVVYPIVFAYSARIDNVGQIVFGVCDNKIGVRN